MKGEDRGGTRFPHYEYGPQRSLFILNFTIFSLERRGAARGGAGGRGGVVSAYLFHNIRPGSMGVRGIVRA